MPTQPLAWRTTKKFLTHLTQRRRGPRTVQYTDGQEEVIEQRTWLLLPLLAPPKTQWACVGPGLLIIKTNIYLGMYNSYFWTWVWSLCVLVSKRYILNHGRICLKNNTVLYIAPLTVSRFPVLGCCVASPPRGQDVVSGPLSQRGSSWGFQEVKETTVFSNPTPT